MLELWDLGRAKKLGCRRWGGLEAGETARASPKCLCPLFRSSRTAPAPALRPSPCPWSSPTPKDGPWVLSSAIVPSNAGARATSHQHRYCPS